MTLFWSAVLLYIFITQLTTVEVRADDANEVNAAPAEDKTVQAECTLRPTGMRLKYNSAEYACIRCHGQVRTLIQFDKKDIGSSENTRKLQEEYCKTEQLCNGIRCRRDNWTCINASDLNQENRLRTPGCPGARVYYPYTTRSPPAFRDSQIPLIIGFTVGGILLAVVVAGIVLGRNQRTDTLDSSEMMTTPVSLSNSEWLSNGGGGGSAVRQPENLRVQEASTEDISSIPMYDIYGQDKTQSQYQLKPNDMDYGYKGVTQADDNSSLDQTSYYGGADYGVVYYPVRAGNEYGNTIRSCRSDELVELDDGYVPGGNFVGSADPQIRGLLELKNSQKHSSNTNRQVLFSDEEQNQTNGKELDEVDSFWVGNNDPTLPINMTHEAMTVSLTHSSQCDGIEYVIEDQDLVAYDEAMSFSKRKRWPGRAQEMSKGNEDEIMRVSLQYRETDSDFEETESMRSHRTSTMKSDKSDVFDDLETTSVGGDNVSKRSSSEGHKNSTFVSSRLHVESPCSESGIEVSCNSKDSCEITVISSLTTSNSTGNVAISCNTRSWNENCKGTTCTNTDFEVKRGSKAKRFLTKGKRATSAKTKSPTAPTHSSRKSSAPVRSNGIQTLQERPHASNLTHVFVDVHRNMMSSDEDLLSCKSVGRKSKRQSSSFSSSEDSIMNVGLSNGKLPRPESSTPRSFRSPSCESNKIHPSIQQRNRSLYASRNGSMGRTPDCWKPRTVRFSSSGSGEYAIPYGSVVP